MSSSKQYTLQPHLVIDETAVGDDVESDVTEIMFKDNLNYQLAWTGTLSGSFNFYVSSNYDSKRPNDASWDLLPLDPAPEAVGSADSWTVDLNQLGSKHVKVMFSYDSGSGDLTARVSGKAI